MVKYVRSEGKNLDMIEELEYEFFQFPLGIHDDILDAMTFLHKLNVNLPAGPKEDGIPVNSPAWLERQWRDEEIKHNSRLPRRFREEIAGLSLS